MIVNKSMFPLQTGFGVISKMQDRFATLQMQLGTGEKASKLSEMGRDLELCRRALRRGYSLPARRDRRRGLAAGRRGREGLPSALDSGGNGRAL